MTTRTCDFHNSRGQKLSGVLHGEPSPSMVICCHGMLSTKDGDKHRRLATALAAHGVATLRFDFAGRGQSEGALFDLTYSGEVRDLYAALDHIASLGAERIGVFGSSMGGAVALLTAARDERIAAVATLGAVAYPGAIEERYPEVYARWLRDGYIEMDGGRIGAAFIQDAVQYEVPMAVRVIRAPLLVLHGAEDEVVPVSDAYDIAAQARNVCLEVIDDADHRLSAREHLDDALARITEFLLQELQETP